jgi:hypothetical protein
MGYLQNGYLMVTYHDKTDPVKGSAKAPCVSRMGTLTDLSRIGKRETFGNVILRNGEKQRRILKR